MDGAWMHLKTFVQCEASQRSFLWAANFLLNKSIISARDSHNIQTKQNKRETSVGALTPSIQLQESGIQRLWANGSDASITLSSNIKILVL